MDKGFKNPEGYSDPTPYHAIKNWYSDEEHLKWRMKQTIKNLLDIAGFKLISIEFERKGKHENSHQKGWNKSSIQQAKNH